MYNIHTFKVYMYNALGYMYMYLYCKCAYYGTINAQLYKINTHVCVLCTSSDGTVCVHVPVCTIPPLYIVHAGPDMYITLYTYLEICSKGTVVHSTCIWLGASLDGQTGCQSETS